MCMFVCMIMCIFMILLKWKNVKTKIEKKKPCGEPQSLINLSFYKIVYVKAEELADFESHNEIHGAGSSLDMGIVALRDPQLVCHVGLKQAFAFSSLPYKFTKCLITQRTVYLSHVDRLPLYNIHK